MLLYYQEKKFISQAYKLKGTSCLAFTERQVYNSSPRLKSQVQELFHMKILFVCHGNICRSPMAEYIMSDMVKRSGFEHEYIVASAATSREEIGNLVYPPAMQKLAEHGISCSGHHARQMTKSDYDYFDIIACMDQNNIRNVYRITGGDPQSKISLLLDYTARKGQEISDPWYTGNFNDTWNDLVEGCSGLLNKLRSDNLHAENGKER